MESIFAGKLSLTDDIPEPPPVPDRSSLSGRFQVMNPPAQQLRPDAWHQGRRPVFEQTSRMLDHIKNTCGQTVNQQLASRVIQVPPLPEPGLSPAAQRVRAEAARLGIDYDAEVTKVLYRMRGSGLYVAPNPWNKNAGPDPMSGISAEARYQAEKAAVELIKRERGIQLTWEEEPEGGDLQFPGC